MTRRWVWMTTLWVLGFVLISVVVAQVFRGDGGEPIVQPGPLVVVVAPTLTWQDITAETTPQLWALAERGAVANLSTHAVADHTCAVDGWLTLSAGVSASQGQTPRPGAPGAGPVCPALPVPVDRGQHTVLPPWPQWAEQAEAGVPSVQLGLFAHILAVGGQCVTAAGTGAAVGAATPAGRLQSFVADPARVDLARCPVTLVAVDDVADPALGRVIDQASPETTLVVTGLADDGTLPAQLRATLIAGPGVPTGLLSSSSTRQPGLLRTADLTALALSRVGPLPGDTFHGRTPVVIEGPGTPQRIEDLRELSHALVVEHAMVAPFFWGYAVLGLLAMAIGTAVVRQARVSGRRPAGTRTARAGALFGAVLGAVPAATFLVGLLPWGTTARAVAWLVVCVTAIAVAGGVVALVGPWRRWAAGPAVFLALGTAVVVALDVVWGSRLQLVSMLGLQPVHGGRYYGMGNVAVGLLATSSLLAAALIAGRWRARSPQLACATVLTVAVIVIVVNGHPALGAEAGGLLALVAGFGYLAFRAADLTMTLRRTAVIGGASVLVLAVLGLLDYLGPRANRTHIGDFVQGLLESGSLAPLRTVFTSNWGLLTAQWVNLLVPVLLVVTTFVLLRRDSAPGRWVDALATRIPMARDGLVAVLICCVVAFVSNDSGTSIPPAGLLVAGPLVLLLAAHRGRSAGVGPAPAHASAPPVGVGAAYRGDLPTGREVAHQR